MIPALLTRISSEPSRSSDLLDDRIDLGSDRDIGLEPDGPDAMPSRDARSGLLGAVAVEIGDRDRDAVLGEPFGRRLADAAGAAGHQRDASFRTSGHVLYTFRQVCPAASLSQAAPPFKTGSATGSHYSRRPHQTSVRCIGRDLRPICGRGYATDSGGAKLREFGRSCSPSSSARLSPMSLARRSTSYSVRKLK